MADLLTAEGLYKSLGGNPILHGISLHCAAGEVLGLLGPNGAGKTTTLRLCYGFLRPDQGSVHIAGHDLHRDPDAARRLLGVCTQDDTFDPDFTVRGNLEQTARYYRPQIPHQQARIAELLERFGLTRFADRKPDTLSGGYKRRLMIARAVVHAPQVVFLDEPTTGLDPEARVAVWELVRHLRESGLAVVLTTHYMDEAEKLSDRLIVLQAGNVRASGSAKSILGAVVGEHVLLVRNSDSQNARPWWEARSLRPKQVLGVWHLPLDAAGLAAFISAFPDLRYEVRSPTLDDLFLALAQETQS